MSATTKSTKPTATAAKTPAVKLSSIFFLRADKAWVEHKGNGGSKPLCATARFKARKGAKPAKGDKVRPCRMCAKVVKRLAKKAA